MSATPKPSTDFDFLMGVWKCRHRYLVRRLADCHDWIEFDGPARRARSSTVSATWTKTTSSCQATAITA